MTSEDNQSGEIKKRLSEALDYYEGSRIPRAAVMSIPYVGSYIDLLLSGKAASKWRERVMKLFEELEVKFRNIDENKIDKEFLNSDEFEGLLFHVIQVAQTTYEQEKISYFAEILSSAATILLSQDARKDRYITLVEELTGIHIRIVKLFAESRRALVEKGNINNVVIITAAEIAEQLSLSQVEAEAFCADLLARGLLYDPQLGLRDYKRGSYALHASAFSFIEFLNLAA